MSQEGRDLSNYIPCLPKVMIPCLLLSVPGKFRFPKLLNGRRSTGSRRHSEFLTRQLVSERFWTMGRPKQIDVFLVLNKVLNKAVHERRDDVFIYMQTLKTSRRFLMSF